VRQTGRARWRRCDCCWWLCAWIPLGRSVKGRSAKTVVKDIGPLSARLGGATSGL